VVDRFLQYPLKELDLESEEFCVLEGIEEEHGKFLKMKAVAEFASTLEWRKKKALQRETADNQEKAIYTLLKENKNVCFSGQSICPAVNLVQFLCDELPKMVEKKEIKKVPSIPKLMQEVQKFMFFDLGLLTAEMLVKKFGLI